MKVLIVIACVLYAASPLDFAPDVIPVFGQLDDLVAVLLGLKTLLSNKKS